MKSGYKRLLGYELIIFIVLFINSFVSSILSNNKEIIFLLIIIVTYKIFFNFEKDRHRFMKDILFETIIFLLTFFILFYLSGIIISFAKIDNYWTINDMIHTIIPIILSIIIKEFLRYQMLTKSEGSKLLTIITTMMFIFLDISTSLHYNLHETAYDTFVYFALTIIPAISLNISASYITLKVGYKPLIMYRLIMELYLYLIPIVPNPNEYILSIIRMFLPVALGFRVYRFFLKEKDEEVERKVKKKRVSSLIIPTLIIAILVYFTSGYFHYHAVAIASGSMSPMIKKGDVVVIEKVDGNFEEIKEGQVIAVKVENVLVVHRLVEKIKVGNEYYFYTKGDANQTRDNYTIKENMVVGVVNHKIPYIGIPTVLLNEL